ncbi:CASP-like protein 4D1 [Cornus florida]|uniref:CASP-like protein 4D1 n=1 Tax=Cornus florida TaxID=4283 RepID=UPI00289888BE|nr:CASP-like protein 4D1 [Cornus florida]
MAPLPYSTSVFPPSTTVSSVVAPTLRVVTFISLMISLIILTTNTATLYINLENIKLRFNDVYAYRYMLATIVFGIAYTLLQTAFTIFQVSMGKRLGGDGLYQFDFFGDKVMSYILATGAAAGFGVTIDLKPFFLGSSINHFFNKASVAASLLLIVFLFTAVSSVFLSIALPKKG